MGLGQGGDGSGDTRPNATELARLRDAEARYRRLVENAPMVAYQFKMNPDGELSFPYVSPRITEIVGRPIAEIRENSAQLLDLIHPDDREGFVREVVESANKRCEYRARFRVVIDGGLRWIEARSTPEVQGDGSVLWDGFLSDVTRQKQAEDENRAHLHFLESIGRIDAVIRTSSDVDAMLRGVLQITLELFGCDRAWLLFPCDPEAGSWQVPMEVTRPSYPGAFDRSDELPMTAPVAAAFRRALATRDVITIDYRDAGTPRDVAEQYSIKTEMHIAVRPRSGTAWSFGVHQCTHYREWTKGEKQLLREISLRLGDALTTLLMQQELKKSEQRFRELFENAPLGYQSLDEKGELIEVNETWSKLLGYPKEEVIGRSFADFLVPNQRGKFRENFPKFKSRGFILGIEFEMLKKDGSTLVVSFEGRIARRADGSFRQTHCVLQDVTHRVRADEERLRLQASVQQAQRMESLGVLAGGIAHDFNNLLGAITGYADLALGEVPSDSPVNEYMEQLLVAATRAAEMVQQILTFSRRAESERRLLSMADVIEEVTKLLRSSLPSSIRLQTEIAPHVPPVLADVAQMEQVIMNLCANAQHAMLPAGGALTLHLEAHLVSRAEAAGTPAAEPGEYVHLAVRDQGVGMPPEVMVRVFEPFYTTKDMGTGTGMGLATSHGIVANHGGFMRVESEPGVGSTFHVYLPAAEGEPEEQELLQTETAGEGRERIMLIDDEEDVLRVTSKMLTSLGYLVTGFTNSRDAMRTFRQAPEFWHLLITDQTMPLLGGIEVLETARELRPELPVIIMTGHSDRLSREPDGGVGADAVLSKPFRRVAFARLVRELLDRTRAQD